jgi:hypothetical protein
MAKYFDRFPQVEYDGQIARNILRKVDLTEKSRREVHTKFDYTIDEAITRVDHLSFILYGDSSYDWTIFLTNRVVDPYYDVYRPEDELLESIKAKYSSIENASSLILYYRNNWADDETELAILDYDSLTTNVKKYYEPVLNDSNQVVRYKRTPIDWTQSTNKIVQLTIADSKWISDSGPITQGSTIANIIQVDRVNNIVLVNHVRGDFAVGTLESTTVTGINVVSDVIPEEEGAFWGPVSAFEVEAEKNELRRYIAIIRERYLYDFETQFREKIK